LSYTDRSWKEDEFLRGFRKLNLQRPYYMVGLRIDFWRWTSRNEGFGGVERFVEKRTEINNKTFGY
jgi:hypothetical protein